ncbi:Uncharacterised protein g6060 [Pycnogonum litorale]
MMNHIRNCSDSDVCQVIDKNTLCSSEGHCICDEGYKFSYSDGDCLKENGFQSVTFYIIVGVLSTVVVLFFITCFWTIRKRRKNVKKSNTEMLSFPAYDETLG